MSMKTPTRMSLEWMSSSKLAHIFHPHSASISIIPQLRCIMPPATSLELAVCTANISVRHPPGSAERHDTTASSSRRMQTRSDSTHWVTGVTQVQTFLSFYHTTTKYSCALMRWFEAIGDAPCPDTTTSSLDTESALLSTLISSFVPLI